MVTIKQLNIVVASFIIIITDVASSTAIFNLLPLVAHINY